jgi:hypothetical protein
MHLARVLAHGLVASLVSLPAWAGDLTVPEEWVGEWEIVEMTEDCGGGNPEMDKYVTTLCPDDLIVDPDPSGENPTECNGTVDGNSFDVTCETVYEIFDCRITITIDMAGERNGDTYTSSGTIMIVVEPIGEFCESSETCRTIETTATRTNSDPEECEDVPTKSATWSGIKARYR